MSGIKTMAEMKEIAKNQTKTIQQQNEILANQHKDLQIRKQQLEFEISQFNESKLADIRHQVNQMVDFAIRSLPWWKRSTRTVVDRATEYLLTIRSEVGKHAAMEQMAQKLVAEDAAAKLSPEQVAEVKASAEKALDEVIDTVSMDKDGKIIAHATIADRETAEMEQV